MPSVSSAVSVSDADTLLVLCCSGAGCANGAREVEGIKCNVRSDVDDRTRSEGGLMVHCEKEKKSF